MKPVGNLVKKLIRYARISVFPILNMLYALAYPTKITLCFLQVSLNWKRKGNLLFFIVQDPLL